MIIYENIKLLLCLAEFRTLFEHTAGELASGLSFKSVQVFQLKKKEYCSVLHVFNQWKVDVVFNL